MFQHLQGGGEDLFSTLHCDEVSKDDFQGVFTFPSKSNPKEKKKPPPVPARKSKLTSTTSVPDVLSNLAMGNTTAIRRPPRSKHDCDSNTVISEDVDHYFPSSEASHRVLIGTLMLQSGIYSKSLSSKSTSSLLTSKIKLSGRGSLSTTCMKASEISHESTNEVTSNLLIQGHRKWISMGKCFLYKCGVSQHFGKILDWWRKSSLLLRCWNQKA